MKGPSGPADGRVIGDIYSGYLSFLMKYYIVAVAAAVVLVAAGV